MSNQGTIRLKVSNDAPAIKKLWNGRFRLEFLCDNNSPKTDWYSENISSILPDYGILQDTNFGSGVSEDWEAIPDSVYPDMRLVETEYVYIPTMGDKRVKLTYETLTASWVEEKDEDTDYELNGLKRVSRTFVALPATTYDKVIGTSTIDSNGTTLYLGSFKIEETDAKWSLSEIWLEAGELSREENSEDAKGSISISQIGGCPAAPAGYTVVNESKNNTQGFETCSRTFYKNDSELSRSNDYVGSQLAESIEVFSPTGAPTPTNGAAVLGNKSTSNVDGIPTTRYTFLVPSVLSESSDKVGSQLAITIEAFNEIPATPTGYVIASEQASDVEGIPTTRYTFLKPSVLSKSEDKIGSQLAINIEAFEETPETPAGYVIANTQVSDVEGIPTTRYTFLKPSVLSKSSDKIGSQLAITIEAFGEIPVEPAGYVIANEQTSDFEGIPTTRYTFLKPSVLSKTTDNVGSQKAKIIESFSEVPETPTGYSLASTQVSDFEGIETNRYTFLKPSILSQSEDKVGSQLAITIETFEEIPSTPAGYVLANTQESDYEGIKTSRYIFLKDSVLLSETEDMVGSQLAKVQEWFNLTVDPTIAGYVIGNVQTSDVGGIPTKRYTFLKDGVLLSETEDKVGSQLAIVQERFNPTEEPTIAAYVIANVRVSDYMGIPTRQYTFLKEDVELSKSEDKVGSQLAIVIEQFDGIPETPSGYSIASTQESDVEGIPTRRYTFLKNNVELSRNEDKVGSQLSITIEQFNGIPEIPASYLIAREQVSDFDGIPTTRYTFLKASILSRSEDKVGSQLAITLEAFSEVPEEPTGYDLANTQVSNVEGIPTTRYTFLKPSILSQSEDKVGSQLAITIEAFSEIPETPAGNYKLANTQESNVDGIKTSRYTFLKPSILSQSEDKVGSQLAITIEAFSEIPETPSGYEIANTRVSDVEGITTTQYTFLKPSILNQSSDKVGSQLAITIEAFSEVPEMPTGYNLASEQVSNFEGIKTTRYTFLKPSILTETADKVGSQNSIVIEAFGLTPTTPAGYVLANTQVSDVAGIPTKRYTFLKKDVELFRSDDKVGSQLAIVIEQFDGIPAPQAGYDLASTQVSNFEGIPTKRYTFLKPSILSLSEDKVGSQLAITVEAFGEIPATPAGYDLASTQVSNFEGIPTQRYTFLKPSILSQTEDKVGSQNAIVIEAFNLEPSAGSHVLAKTEISNFNGIPTKRYTFLADCVLSKTEDLIGSQKAEIIETFGAETPTPSNGGVLAKTEISNVEGIPTKRHTFLKPGILSLSENFTDPNGTETGAAFNMTDNDIQAAIGLAGYGYLLIESTLSDYNGIQTTSFTYKQKRSSDVIDYDLNGLMRLTTVIRGDDGPDYGKVIGESSITKNGVELYLANLKIVDSEIKEETYVWIEAGVIDETQKPIDGGLRKIDRISFIFPTQDDVEEIGVVVSKKRQNYNGYPVWATTTIQLRDGTDPTSGVASEHSIFVPFTYPGVANATEDLIASGSFTYSSYTSTAYDVQLIPPVTADIEATVTISYQTLSEIDALPFSRWSPKEWASVESSWSWVLDSSLVNQGSPSIGGKSRIGSKYKGLPGYRTGVASVSYVGYVSGGLSGDEALATFFGQTVGLQTGGDWDASGSINITGGPENPEGNTYVIKNPVLEEAFSDIDGTQYYRKVIITATIPPQI